MMPTNDPHDHDRALEREEVLLGRVVDHEATPADWAELERLGDTDPTVWTRLARAERAHARLSAAIDDAIAIAECVDLPRANSTSLQIAGRRTAPGPDGGRRWGSFIRHGAGWAIAACLALVLGVQTVMGPDAGVMTDGSPTIAVRPTQPINDRSFGARDDDDPGTGSGGVMRFANYSPEDLWSGYVSRGAVEGRVLREMPSMVVEIRPLEGGDEYELLIERRVLERRIVSSKDTPVMRIYMDEYGEPVAVPVDPEEGLSGMLAARESPV